jgi:hypothetical protein
MGRGRWNFRAATGLIGLLEMGASDETCDRSDPDWALCNTNIGRRYDENITAFRKRND